MIDEVKKEELRAGLRTYVESVTEPDPRAGRNKYKCPLCGSGSRGGRNSDGAFSIMPDGKGWKCFSCQKGGDIFTLIGLVEGIDDFKDQARRAAEVSGITMFTKKAGVTKKTEETKKTEIIQETQNTTGQYKAYIEQCAAAANQTGYYKSRGFSDDVIKRFHLGYDAEKKVVVIPYDKEGSYYITRRIDSKEFRKPNSAEAGIEPVYNRGALYEPKPCFVTESAFDAISIMIAGQGACSAVALGGTGSQKLINQIKKQAPAKTLVLSFDNDEPGQKATRETAEELKKLDIPFIEASYSLELYNGKSKDANEMLLSNQAQLTEDIQASIKEIERLENAEKEARLSDHFKDNAAMRLVDFVDGIKGKVDTPYTSTGFSELDKELDGGFYPGLYILGAISSLGKTTLMLQIADQVAMQGKDVLYFTLEMAASELISKSISRLTYKLCKGNTKNAKTARGITTASRYAHYSQPETQLIDEAIIEYSKAAQYIYMYEGIGDIGVDYIRAKVNEHIELTGKTPVVFIDYIQILAPYDMRASDKQNVDKAVLELKRISRDFRTPVIGISSFNRDNYSTEVNMTAFKESGAIEYGSDVLLALQPQGMKQGYTATEQKDNAKLVKACKASAERSVEAVILKNRNGKTGGKVGFTYYALFNNFAQDYGLTLADDEDIPFSGKTL